MCRRLSIVFAAALLLAGMACAGASAASPQASLPDIEDEVMCPTCGVPLNQSFSPQAERERSFIRQEIARGKTKEQIKQALVSEFGEDVLAAPRDEGFDLTAYLVPTVGFAVAAAALGIGLVRWRRRAATAPPEPEAPLSPTDSARLEQDLSRYDL